MKQTSRKTNPEHVQGNGNGLLVAQDTRGAGKDYFVIPDLKGLMGDNPNESA